MKRAAVVLGFAAVTSLAAGRPAGAASYVNRPLTLPRSEFALDFGLGLGHEGPFNGFGFNLELHAGLTSRLELGIRTGIRAGTDGRITTADYYGRTFETETYGVDHKTIANPELSLRWALARSHIVDVGLDTRLYIPTEGTPAGIMLALPIALRFSSAARLDTGVYVPIIFGDPAHALASIPAHLWFQLDQLALGFLTGVRVNDGVDVPLGLGINYALAWDADLRFWFLFPDVNHTSDAFGGGVGLEVRF
jgi:hypothetical protein